LKPAVPGTKVDHCPLAVSQGFGHEHVFVSVAVSSVQFRLLRPICETSCRFARILSV
jgi:hypothetical protein